MPRTNETIRRTSTALAAAGLLLALAGCTDAPVPGPSASSLTAVEVPVTESGSASPTAGPSGRAELGYLDAAALKSAVQQWAAATPGTVVNDQEALRKQLPEAQKWLEGVTVVPAECGLYGVGSLTDQLDQAAMAAAVLPQNAGGDLTIASYRDRAGLVANVAAQQHLDQSCSTYAVTAGGQTITSKLTPLQVTSSAPFTTATMLESVNGDAKNKQVSVRLIDGSLMLTATRAVKSTPEAATAQALKDAEGLLAILRAAPPAATPAP